MVAVVIPLAASFSKNVVVAGTVSYQMLGIFIILSFSDQERALPSSTEISVLTFVVKKAQ